MKTGRAVKQLGAWLAAAVMALAAAADTQAAGLLIADGGFGGVLEVVEHDVRVTINNGIAVTKVTQVFRNTENRQVEALYTFPVPEGASVANFSMWIGGKEMVGEVLEKNRAREIYNSYKVKKQDPGLLEQTDYKTFEMRIFPIAANAEQKVEITYYQEMSFDNDWVNYIYPLATVTTGNAGSRTQGKFALTMEIRSEVPISQIESPSHGEDFVVAKHSESYVQASLETDGGDLNRDVVLACELKRPKSGIDVITSKEKGEDGYFCMTITAGEDLGKLDTGMDYVFVMDISGSMGDDRKLTMSRKSVESFIEALDEKDRFDVVTFNITPEMCFGSLKSGDEASIAKAVAFMEEKSAKGGTVLGPAMNVAYKYADPDRTLNVVLLSDGMTEQDERAILLQKIQERPRNSRVFCIGVGNEVNRPLLEQMANDSGGLAAFVSKGSNYKRLADAFRRKLMHPAATDVRVTFSDIQVYDVEPKVLPNLYHGSPIRLYGRYKGEGAATVSLNADVRGIELAKKTSVSLPGENDANPEIERMWAWKRIDELQKVADRTNGRASVVNEIVSLGETYSIVTEYTSFLVLENDQEFQRWKIDRRNAERVARDRSSQEKLRRELDAIRSRASADLGPIPERKVEEKEPVQVSQSIPSVQTSSQPRPSSRNNSPWSGPGTAPVGPLFVAVAAWLNRRKKIHRS